MAINVVDHRQDDYCLVTVRGITNSQAEVSPLIRKKSPAFNEAISRLDSSLNMLNLTRVCSVRAVFDSVVPLHSSVITGASQGVAWSVVHLFTITLCLSLYGGYVVYLIRTFKKAHSA